MVSQTITSARTGSTASKVCRFVTSGQSATLGAGNQRVRTANVRRYRQEQCQKNVRSHHGRGLQRLEHQEALILLVVSYVCENFVTLAALIVVENDLKAIVIVK